ncbi:MAG: hypothetical protein Q4Q53_01505 [Methanocorpusculum sp.]|nr:hypothetical protein [Methanocorpusculum sp.]
MPDRYEPGNITVSRDPVVAAVVKWAIAVLAVVVIIGLVQSLGFVMPWENGSAVAADAGTIVYLSGNDVLVSIVEGSDINGITAISLAFEKSGEKISVPDVKPTIASGEPIIIEGMALGYSGTDNIILEATFEGGVTKVLSKTHLEFT